MNRDADAVRSRIREPSRTQSLNRFFFLRETPNSLVNPTEPERDAEKESMPITGLAAGLYRMEEIATFPLWSTIRVIRGT